MLRTKSEEALRVEASSEREGGPVGSPNTVRPICPANQCCPLAMMGWVEDARVLTTCNDGSHAIPHPSHPHLIYCLHCLASPVSPTHLTTTLLFTLLY